MYLYVHYKYLFVGMFVCKVTESLRCVAFVVAHVSTVIVKFSVHSLHIFS